MAGDGNKKSLIKDITILLSVWGPILFTIIGGMIWQDGGFDGTIMERLFPAMFFGFCAGWGVFLAVSNMCSSSVVWIICAVIAFIVTTLSDMMFEAGAEYILVGLGVILCLMVLVKWVKSW